jgi:predicted DNA-binding protein YlxM (UPF0122 family)
MSNKKLRAELEDVKFSLNISRQVVTTLEKQVEQIMEMYEKQLAQQDYYIQRKDEEFNVLKRMYRDDIINGGLK